MLNNPGHLNNVPFGRKGYWARRKERQREAIERKQICKDAIAEAFSECVKNDIAPLVEVVKVDSIVPKMAELSVSKPNPAEIHVTSNPLRIAGAPALLPEPEAKEDGLLQAASLTEGGEESLELPAPNKTTETKMSFTDHLKALRENAQKTPVSVPVDKSAMDTDVKRSFTDHLKALREKAGGAPPDASVAAPATPPSPGPATSPFGRALQEHLSLNKEEQAKRLEEVRRRENGIVVVPPDQAIHTNIIAGAPSKEEPKEEPLIGLQAQLKRVREQRDAGMFDVSPGPGDTAAADPLKSEQTLAVKATPLTQIIPQHSLDEGIKPTVYARMHVRQMPALARYNEMDEYDKKQLRQQVNGMSANGLLSNPENALKNVWAEMHKQRGFDDHMSLADKVLHAANQRLQAIHGNPGISEEQYKLTIKSRVEEMLYLDSVKHEKFDASFKKELFTNALEQLPSLLDQIEQHQLHDKLHHTSGNSHYRN